MKANAKTIGFASERTQRRKHFKIDDVPIPLRRARFTGTHCWDSQKQQKMIIGLALQSQLADEPLFEGPLDIDILFYFPISKRLSKENQLIYKDKPHIFKPDLDNLIKMYLDCSNNILFKDDCIVSTIHARKLYGIPRTEIIITELR